MKNWILAIRPKTLFASLSPVLLGLSFAYYKTHQLNLLVASLTLICALLLQVASNLINDYYDFKSGVDLERKFGPLRVTQSGLIAPEKVKASFILILSLSFFLGIYLMYTGGLIITIMGLASILGALAYSTGPYPFSRHALGELFAFIYFGVVAVTGTYYLQTQVINIEVILLSFIPGFLSAQILSINNLRDMTSDKKNKKKTIANLTSESFARMLPLIFFVLAQISHFVFIKSINIPLLYMVFVLYFIFNFKFKKLRYIPINQELNNYLASTAKCLFLLSLLQSIILCTLK
jgi:1,4-dihydroxy-2-naphthoate octaprenyltransferase